MDMAGCIMYTGKQTNPTEDTLESVVWRYIETHRLLVGRQTVGAAVSGGADSMALLICLLRLSERHEFSVAVLHYDHGTREGQSARDAQFVRNFCAASGIECVTRTGDVPQMAAREGIGLELAGRKAREAFFLDMLQSGVVDAVATAHHMDDNAESIVLHMIRGCGTGGLAGIRPERNGIIRPLLGVSRREILEYLDRTGTPHVEDITNADTSLDRNYVRHVVLGGIRERLNPSVSEALARLSESASRDTDFLQTTAEAAFRECCTKQEDGACALDRKTLCALHPAVASRVVQIALACAGRVLDVERIHIDSVLRAAHNARTGSSFALGGGYTARAEHDLLVIGRAPKPARPFLTDFVLPGFTPLPGGAVLESGFVPHRGADTAGSRTEYVDADRIPRDAVVRTRLPGDRIHPLGAAGTKKLKEYFIDRKIPRPERDRIPLLASGSHILWVIGSVLSEDICVLSSTRRICRLRLIGADVWGRQAEQE